MVNMLLLKLLQVTQVTQIVGDAFFRTAVQVSADFARLGEYIFLFYLVRDRLDRTIRRFLAEGWMGPGWGGTLLWIVGSQDEANAANSWMPFPVKNGFAIFEITGVAVLLHWHSVSFGGTVFLHWHWDHLDWFGVNRVWFVNVSRTFREGSGFSKFHSEVVSSAIRPCLRCIRRKWKIGKDDDTWEIIYKYIYIMLTLD